MLAAGAINKRVIVEERQVSRSAMGEALEDWVVLGERWVSIEPLTARELFAQQQVQAQVTHRVRMRYWSSVTHTCRLRTGSRVLNIVAVRDIDDRHVELELLCVEVVA